MKRRVLVYYEAAPYEKSARMILGMDKQHFKPDANQDAARIVGETAGQKPETLPPDLEAAWEAWSRGVAKVDARGMALIRAAFEAGAAAARRRR
jgi:hypothetical protein